MPSLSLYIYKYIHTYIGRLHRLRPAGAEPGRVPGPVHRGDALQEHPALDQALHAHGGHREPSEAVRDLPAVGDARHGGVLLPGRRGEKTRHPGRHAERPREGQSAGGHIYIYIYIYTHIYI